MNLDKNTDRENTEFELKSNPGEEEEEVFPQDIDGNISDLLEETSEKIEITLDNQENIQEVLTQAQEKFTPLIDMLNRLGGTITDFQAELQTTASVQPAGDQKDNIFSFSEKNITTTLNASPQQNPNNILYFEIKAFLFSGEQWKNPKIKIKTDKGQITEEVQWGQLPAIVESLIDPSKENGHIKNITTRLNHMRELGYI
ncbi:hypothetical protein K9M59_01615 [Candidatus Gracilibacteria bacterium]|nr:hypothetical protein [Candidatus Gracilibacteria bacterium]MCF7819767.1 hypothetical protein [Candidatus Gracilibacteria bacterium]